MAINLTIGTNGGGKERTAQVTALCGNKETTFRDGIGITIQERRGPEINLRTNSKTIGFPAVLPQSLADYNPLG